MWCIADDAFELAHNLVNPDNATVIFTSLMSKALSDKSVLSIQNTLEFGYENLTPLKLNTSLQFGFIPSIIKCGMVRNFDEMLNLLVVLRFAWCP